MDSEDEVPDNDQYSYTCSIIPSFHSQAVTALAFCGSNLLSGSRDQHVSVIICTNKTNLPMQSHRIKGSTMGCTILHNHKRSESIKPSVGTGCVEPLPSHWVYQCPAGGLEQQETEENHGH